MGFSLNRLIPSLNKKNTINTTVKLVTVLLSINKPSVSFSVNVLKNDIPNITLHIAGSGDATDYVLYAKEHNYDFVEFLGLVEHAELMKRIRAADCFALNTGYEGLSHLLLEAMALETPIVTTGVEGNVELLDTGDRGHLVKYNDKDELQNALRAVFDKKEKTHNATQNAKKFVAEFTEERMVKATLKELEGVTQKT